MSDSRHDDQQTGDDKAPGEEGDTESVSAGVRGYVIGLGLATLLTIASFWAAGTGLIYGPGVPVALIALAIAQMGVHLVFFLHITTGPDNTNNVMALAFGVLIVALVMIGSLWIMAHLHHNLMPASAMMEMQR